MGILLGDDPMGQEIPHETRKQSWNAILENSQMRANNLSKI